MKIIIIIAFVALVLAIVFVVNKRKKTDRPPSVKTEFDEKWTKEEKVEWLKKAVVFYMNSGQLELAHRYAKMLEELQKEE